ncbi:aspartyl-phosphate phosphatase Spo0E family protein [Ornithinibacillus scapharcae]|uniref:aspartyl-phosphate phosphatase Spo0E family protein n=1 Tax=Ornithinibacillus scapharcae TaxID=1147159 RepID=UPI000225B6C7|nr:aspartyl-phosphate phosphatase Spo0E family protein [Ornithinibacillus scapharcae]
MDKHLLQKIEQCRKEMIALSDTYHLTSEVVVETSKKLDLLLNEYQLSNASK